VDDFTKQIQSIPAVFLNTFYNGCVTTKVYNRIRRANDILLSSLDVTNEIPQRIILESKQNVARRHGVRVRYDRRLESVHNYFINLKQRNVSAVQYVRAARV